MKLYSTRQASRELGISLPTLNRYIADEKIPVPPVTEITGMRVRVWNEADIEKVRKLLPKIANGRKTRYQKLRAKNAPAGASPPQHAKTARAGDPGPAPHKQRSTKKKK